MANHPSAEKRNRQRIKRTARNSSVTSTVRTAVKKARVAIAAGDKAAAGEAVAKASKLLARAASKGVLPDRSASRTTSRIQSHLSKLATS
ncbi:MAG: 30S ribosomal protein S20 [Myxococcales bacterium]